MTEAAWQDETVHLATGAIRVRRRGAGPPLVLLHRDIGHVDGLPLYDDLARQYTLIAPDMPGFGGSERLEFARHLRDLAIVLRTLLAKLDLSDVTLVGLGFGGWVAAEMATMDAARLRRLVLVGPMGLRPRDGFILDQMMVSHADYVRAGFHHADGFERVFGSEQTDEVKKAWDFHREVIARIAWKPYMFSLQLPPLLGNVDLPASVVWGAQDQVVPLECGEAYARALPNADLQIVEDAGHFVEIEQPEALARIILQPVLDEAAV